MNTKKRVEKLEAALGKDTEEIRKITILNYREDGTVSEEKLYRVDKTGWTEIKHDTENEVA